MDRFVRSMLTRFFVYSFISRMPIPSRIKFIKSPAILHYGNLFIIKIIYNLLYLFVEWKKTWIMGKFSKNCKFVHKFSLLWKIHPRKKINVLFTFLRKKKVLLRLYGKVIGESRTRKNKIQSCGTDTTSPQRSREKGSNFSNEENLFFSKEKCRFHFLSFFFS